MTELATYLSLLFATQLVLHLYGAGLRRPFGSLASVPTVPSWLRQARNIVWIAAWLFVTYVAIM